MVRKVGKNSSESIVGTSADDILFGLAGNDTIFGGGGNDAISGGSGHDKLSGGSGNDTLSGGTGNDQLSGGSGNDRIAAGAGTDTAIFSGVFASYTITKVGGSFIVAGPEGTDTLTSVELLKFADRTVDLRAPVNAGDDTVNTTAIATVNGSVLANDIDPDITLTKVDGQPGVFGSTITLASGALLTMAADGTFSYDPNGQFDTVPTGTVATDSFTYEVVGLNGSVDTATVTVVIAGTAAAPGATFTLTVGTDGPAGFEGTDKNDTFNAPLAGPFGSSETLTALDDLDGGAGTDTLKIFGDDIDSIGNGGDDFEIPVSSVANIENIEITSSDDLDEADMSAWTGVQNLTIIADDDVDDVTSGATNKVVIVAGENVDDTQVNSAKTVEITNGGLVDVDATAAATVLVNNTGGNHLIQLVVGSPTSVEVNTENGQNNVDVQLQGNAIGKVTIKHADGVSITAATANDIAIEGANTNGDDVDLNVANLNKVVLTNWSDQSTGLFVNTTSTTLNLDVSMADEGGAGLDQNTVEEDSPADAIKTLNVKLLGNANLLVNMDAATAVNFSGSGDIEADLTGNDALLTVTSTTTGNADITVNGGLSTPDVTTGSGKDIVTVAGTVGAGQDIKTGAGDDLVDLTNGGPLGAIAFTADGEGGTEDTLRLNVTDAQDGVDRDARIAGFENLSIDGQLVANAVDVRNYDTIQDLTLEDGFGVGANVLGLDSGGSLTSLVAGGGAAALTVTFADNTQVDDALNLNLLGGGNFGSVSLAGIETLNLKVSGDGASTQVALTTTDTDVLNITEENLGPGFGGQVTITGAALGAGGITTLNASTLVDTGVVADFTGNAGPVTVTTGAGADNIVGTVAGESITVGAGADTVAGGGGLDLINLGVDTAIDRVVYFGGLASHSQGVTTDVITNFGVNDVFDFNGFGFAVVNYLGEAAGSLQVLTALDGSAGAGVLDILDSTLYIDVDGNQVIDNSDMTIKVAGVVDLSGANFI